MRTLHQNNRRLTDSFLRTVYVLLLLLASTLAAFADGCYIPHKTYLQTPTIPAQTAIISFRDGQETLVVQSLLQAEGQEFGWIIPVPAPPTEMRVGTPGMIKTLQVQLQPRIISDPWFSGLGFLIMLCAWITFWGLRTIYDPQGKIVSFTDLILSIFIIVILAGFSLPALGTAGSSVVTIRGITLSNSQTIGHYDVATLKADSAQALNNWLQANQLRTLDAAAQRIVNSYIREGWCFVTARLHRDGNQLAAPHPLVLTFPTKEPIYPMRLTALTGQPVHVELFLIGDRQWQSRDLTMQYSDQFFLKETNHFDTSEKEPEFFATTYRASLGHPQIKPLLWQGCVITKLTGDVTPLEMTHDYRFNQVGAGSPYRAVVYSKAAARRDSICWGLGFWCVGLLVTVQLYRKQINSGHQRPFLSKVLLFLFSYCVLLSVGIYLTQTRVEVRDLGRRGWRALSSHSPLMRDFAQTYLKDNPTVKGPVAAAELEEMLREVELSNPYLGGKIVQEDSPGNFEVIERNGTTIIRLYREDGSYLEVTRPDPATKQPPR